MFSIAINIMQSIAAALKKAIPNNWTDGNLNYMSDGNGNRIVLLRKE